ncbi:uncharacterized protein [Diabrotica undecimpunctata]|uniref:uncharacterized protein n=1 Tax=Diabrotica undecimpunctata TaxID=50387 RepID=UPI003B634EFA
MLDSNYVPFDDSSEKSSGSPEINNFSSHFCPKQVNKDELNIEEQSNSPSSSVSLNIHQHVEETCNINTKSLKKSVFCYFCESVVLNFPRHILRNHQSELEVQKILVYPPRSKTRKQLLFALRKKGNYLLGSANLKPVRKGSADTNYLPCDHCFGMYSAKNLWRHRKICNPYSITRNSQSQAQNFLLRHLKLDTYLKETVFPRIRADNVSLVAKKDPLICAFGSRYLKIHREQHFIPVASRKMRELAKKRVERSRETHLVFIDLEKAYDSVPLKKMFEVLKRSGLDSTYIRAIYKLYENAVSCVKIGTRTSNKFKVTKGLKQGCCLSPTLFKIYVQEALRNWRNKCRFMGIEVGQETLYTLLFADDQLCCDIALMLNAKKSEFTVRSASAKADLKSLIQIIEGNWKYDISSQAANDLDMKKWNKVTLIPLASDLMLLKNYLVRRANESCDKLQKNNNDINSYVFLLETIYCRLILLNRRRPGELERMTIQSYISAKDNQCYEEFSEAISETERILMKSFRRIVIKGKRERGVPVLVRYEVMSKYAKLCGAKNPSALTCTRLRKHLATLTQLFTMSENDMEQLASFMGHTLGIHRSSYRLPDDIYQTVKISKLLLLMEKGKAGQFKGKSLEEIEINLEEDIMEDDDGHNNEKDWKTIK